MKKIFSFLAGALVGAAVGGIGVLLFTPSSGEDLRATAEARWNAALSEARMAQEEKQRELELQFEMAKRR